MQHNRTLTVLSLLSIALMTFHFTADFALGLDKGAASLVTVAILAVWLCGTLLFAGQRTGYVIMLIGGLMGGGMPIIHFRGRVLDGPTAASSTGFFFIWVLLAIGATGSVSAIISARELWRQRGNNRRAVR